MSVLVVVPTIDRARAQDTVHTLKLLSQHGMQTALLANSHSTAILDVAAPPTVVDMGENLGFGRAVRRAVELLDDWEWEWLLVLNDDLVFGATSAQQIADTLRQPSIETSGLIVFDEGPDLPLPQPGHVFLLVSNLLRAVPHNLAQIALSPRRGQTYRPFSAVAISADAWQRLNGFDEAFPFCYEDADLTRRYWALGQASPLYVDVGLSHAASSTSRRWIRCVVPAVAWSATQYLIKTGHAPWCARLLVTAALVCRWASTLMSESDPKEHRRGIRDAIVALWRQQEPPLPLYDLT